MFGYEGVCLCVCVCVFTYAYVYVGVHMCFSACFFVCACRQSVCERADCEELVALYTSH